MLAPAPSGASLALQGSRLRYIRKDPADLEHRRSRIERQSRRDDRKLARAAVSFERAFAAVAFQSSRFARDERWREIEERGVAFSRCLLAELGREVRPASIRRVTLPEDRKSRIFQLREIELGKG